MSFAEWTATSIDPASSASSSSLTKTPRSPISPKGFVRSRSPAVVIGRSAISTPGARSRCAASSACVRASLLPRLPTLTSTIVLEPEEVPPRLHVAGAVGRGGLLQTHDRHVQELVHDLRRQRLDRPPLALGQAAEAALRLRQLTRADRLGPLAQRGDGRGDVEGGLPLPEALGLLRDDRLCARGLAPPAAQALADD